MELYFVWNNCLTFTKANKLYYSQFVTYFILKKQTFLNECTCVLIFTKISGVSSTHRNEFILLKSNFIIFFKL